MKKRVEYILKHNVFIQQTYKIILSSFFRFIGIFIKTDPQLILFNSFGGRKYNDSPRVIFEKMLNFSPSIELKYVWAFEKPDEFEISPKASKIKIDTWKYFITALKAKYWVSSVNIERGLKFKKKNTIYLNTWHGAGTKKIGNAVAGRKDFDYSNVNYMMTQSNYEKEIFRKDFQVREDNFLLSGFPRSDELFHPQKENIKSYREALNLPENKKVILYAPTWRESTNKGNSYDIKPPISITKWEERLKEDFVILFRTHAFTTKVLNMRFNEFVIDASSYENVNHLLFISDILITDYSTIVFDYSILEKPFICFGYDYEKYKEERGFYLDMEEEYPSGVLRNEDQVLDYICNLDYSLEKNKVSLFKKKYIEAGGDSANIAIKSLLNL